MKRILGFKRFKHIKGFAAAAFFLFGLFSIGVFSLPAAAQSFDQSHAAFTALLKKHVVAIDGGKSSQVKYAELQNQFQRKTVIGVN